MARGCLQGVKYLMFAFNLLFWLGGCGILGVGIWLAATQGNFATLSSSFPSLSAANLLIVTGSLVMAIGFVGCIGAIKEHRCLLLTFFVMLLLVFLLEATVAILFFAYTDKIDRYAQRDLKKGLHLYGTPGNVGLTNAWSIIQTDFRCCGVSNYTDWFEVYNATRVPDSCCLEFSESCGLHAPGTWWKAPCYETVKMWLQENLLAVGVFGLCTALVQVWRAGPREPQDPSYPALVRVETLRAWSLCPQAEVGFVGNGQGHRGEVTFDVGIPRARLLVDGGAALCRGPCGRFLQPQEHGAWRSQDCPVQSERGQPRPDLQVQLLGPWSP
uniref:Tetraspanin-4 n=1 Tax=Rhinolophus ferrumequinum TaxID=59479 RepID=A0A671E223_RHIFE